MRFIMRLSILIACYNGEATIADQLEGIAGQQWNESCELIFINNRCTDNSLSIVKNFSKRLPNLKIVDAYERQGKAFALNKGILFAEGESFVFADADDQAAPGWLSAMEKALENHELVACRMDTTTLNSPNIQKSRGIIQFNGLQEINYPPYLPHAGGGTIGIHRELHFKIGGFDETLPHLEDTDYIWRAQLAGARLFFLPDAVMRIRFRDNLRNIYQQSRNYAEYNVFLSKKFRNYGKMISHPWRKYFKKWRKFIFNNKQHFILKDGHFIIAKKLGWLIGLLIGAIKYRVPPI